MKTIEMMVLSQGGQPQAVVLEDPLLFAAGYTGRSNAAVNEHIGELQAFGVPPPENVPCLWALPNWLLARGNQRLQVPTATSSGEAEPVIIRVDGSLYVTVGSDHTDRNLERSSVALSKLVCPKVISSEMWPIEDVEEIWDTLHISAYTGESHTRYQDNILEYLLPPLEVLKLIDGRISSGAFPFVLFLGTIPIIHSDVRFDDRFSVILEDRSSGRRLTCSYSIENLNTVALAEG